MPPPKPPAVVHVDLDGASAIYAVRGWPYPYEEDPLFETGLNNTLAFLQEAGVKATLFVIAEDLDDPRKRALLESAVGQGHEIGCHSYTHRKLTTLSREDQVREVVDSRERISGTLDVPVEGFRAPYFDIDESVLGLVADAGYTYDSSFFPGRHVAITGKKINTGPTPFQWPGRELLEIPMPAYRPLPVPFHVSYSLVLGGWYFRLGLRRFQKTGAPLVWLLHLTDLADPMPSTMLRGPKAKFFTLSFLDKKKKRNRCNDMLTSIAREYTLVSSQTLASTVEQP